MNINDNEGHTLGWSTISKLRAEMEPLEYVAETVQDNFIMVIRTAFEHVNTLDDIELMREVLNVADTRGLDEVYLISDRDHKKIPPHMIEEMGRERIKNEIEYMEKFTPVLKKAYQSVEFVDPMDRNELIRLIISVPINQMEFRRDEVEGMLSNVHHIADDVSIIYLLFNEGYQRLTCDELTDGETGRDVNDSEGIEKEDDHSGGIEKEDDHFEGIEKEEDVGHGEKETENVGKQYMVGATAEGGIGGDELEKPDTAVDELELQDEISGDGEVEEPEVEVKEEVKVHGLEGKTDKIEQVTDAQENKPIPQTDKEILGDIDTILNGIFYPPAVDMEPTETELKTRFLGEHSPSRSLVKTQMPGGAKVQYPHFETGQRDDMNKSKNIRLTEARTAFGPEGEVDGKSNVNQDGDKKGISKQTNRITDLKKIYDRMKNRLSGAKVSLMETGIRDGCLKIDNTRDQCIIVQCIDSCKLRHVKELEKLVKNFNATLGIMVADHFNHASMLFIVGKDLDIVEWSVFLREGFMLE